MPTFGPGNIGWYLMGFGLLTILIGVGLILSWSVNMAAANVFYIVTGWFVMMLGVAVLAVGLSGYSRWDRPPVPKVRCRQCYTLNYESAIHCRKCGANMF